MFLKTSIFVLWFCIFTSYPCRAAILGQLINRLEMLYYATQIFQSVRNNENFWNKSNMSNVDKNEIESLQIKIETLTQQLKKLEDTIKHIEKQQQTGYSDEITFGAVQNKIDKIEEQSSIINEALFGKQFLSRNDKEVFVLYENFANKGNPIAQYYLGLMYEDGRGLTARNTKKACELLGKAAKKYSVAEARYKSRCNN